MALTLVTGRPNAGKTRLLYEPVIAQAAAGRMPIVLLPTRPDARRATEEFATRGVTGVRTGVLDEWIADLWSIYGDGRRLVTPGARQALLRRVCESTELQALATSASKPGFIRTLAVLAEHFPCDVAPQLRTRHDAEMAAIVRRYLDVLVAEALVEPAEAAMLLGATPPQLDGLVAVNRFADLSRSQEAVLCGISNVIDVLIALSWDEDHPATEALTPLVRRLSVRGEHVRVALPEQAEEELALLERDLYRPGAPHVPSGSVVMAEAAGEDLEASLAVDLAARLVQEGFAPERIAIVFRDAARRSALISAAAAQEGIAINVDVAKPIGDTPMGRALLGLLDVASGREPTRERMLAFLLSPYSGAGAEEIEHLDIRWREQRAAGSRLLDDAATLSRLTARMIDHARSACATPVKPEAVRNWQKLTDALLLSSEQRRGLACPAGELDCAVHREVLRALSELAQSVAPSVHESHARAALGALKVSAGSSERDAVVQYTEAHRVRGRRFDAVILGGLTAGEFSSERPPSFTSELLGRFGLSSGADERDAERLLFYTVVTRPRKKLVLLRQVADESGAPLRPSVFWDEVLDLYRADGADAESLPPGLPHETRPLTAVALGSVAYTPGTRTRRAAGSSSQRPPRGALGSEEVRAQLACRDEFSVSELESYASCPYKWFFERGVRPREIDARFDAREIGTRSHVALARFYERWAASDPPRRVTPELLPDALALAEEVVAEVLAQGPKSVGLAETFAEQRVRAGVMDVVRDDATFLTGYVPLAHEYSFGRAEGLPFSFGGVSVRGRVDRVDVGDDGVVVTDYKAGSSIVGHGSFAGQGVMQLPVYLAAVSALLKREAHGAIYRSLRSRRVRGFWRSDRLSLSGPGTACDGVDVAGLEAILCQAEERVSSAAAGIRSGEIAPRPSTPAACGFCGARGFCGEADA